MIPVSCLTYSAHFLNSLDALVSSLLSIEVNSAGNDAGAAQVSTFIFSSFISEINFEEFRFKERSQNTVLDMPTCGDTEWRFVSTMLSECCEELY